MYYIVRTLTTYDAGGCRLLSRLRFRTSYVRSSRVMFMKTSVCDARALVAAVCSILMHMMLMILAPSGS